MTCIVRFPNPRNLGFPALFKVLVITQTLIIMENINIVSIIISVLLPTVIGMLYYNKALFGKAWMASIGMTEEKQKSANMALMMGIGLLTSILITMFLFGFVNSPGQEGQYDTFKHGAFHGAMVSVFLVIPTFISNGLFEQKTWRNMLINGLYWLITLTLMGGVLDAMNHLPNEGAPGM